MCTHICIYIYICIYGHIYIYIYTDVIEIKIHMDSLTASNFESPPSSRTSEIQWLQGLGGLKSHISGSGFAYFLGLRVLALKVLGFLDFMV